MSTNCDTFFTHNTDITGIGVRVAFYLQMNLLVILASLSPDETGGSFWTLTSMTLGLVIAGISSARNGELSFFNGVQVVNLVGFSNAAQMTILSVTKLSIRSFKLRDKILTYIFIFAVLLASVLSLVLWAIASRFGPQPECESLLKFYFMFWKASMSFQTIRILALVWYSSLICCIIFISLGKSPEQLVKWALALVSLEYLRSSVEDERMKKFLKLRFLGPGLSWILAMLLSIPPVELFIKERTQSSEDDDSEWSFGQILSVVSVIPTLVLVILAVIDKFRDSGEEANSDSDAKDPGDVPVETEEGYSLEFRPRGGTREYGPYRDTREYGPHRNAREDRPYRDTREDGSYRNTREDGLYRNTREYGPYRNTEDANRLVP